MISQEKVGGVTVKNELNRLLTENIVKSLKDTAPSSDSLSRAILYGGKGGEPPIGINPLFRQEMARYRNAMKLIAMSLTKEQWLAMQRGEFEGNAMRNFCAEVERQTMDKAFDLEVTYNKRKPNKIGSKKSRKEPTLHSLSTRWTQLQKAMKGEGFRMTEDDILELVSSHCNERGRAQRSMRNYFGASSQPSNRNT